MLIGTGFGLARFSAPQPAVVSAPNASLDVAALRAELSAEIRRELHDDLRVALRSELAAEQVKFASDEAGRREAFQQVMAQGLSELEMRQLASTPRCGVTWRRWRSAPAKSSTSWRSAAQPAEGIPQQQ